MRLRQVLGVLGSVVLAIGVFTPIIGLPQAGSITYFRDGGGDGMMLALALVAFALALRNQCAWLLPTAFTVFAVLITTIRTARFTILPPDWQPQARPQAIEVHWGSAVIVVGALLLLASALLQPARASSPDKREPRYPLSVLVTTFIMAAVLMATVWLWPSGRFILSSTK
jgi:hypothetical protein